MISGLMTTQNNTLVILLVSLTLFVSKIFCQPQDPAQYFPLNAGNEWHYKISNSSYDYNNWYTKTSYSKIKCLKDTTLSSGKTYFQMEKSNNNLWWFPGFIRTDSLGNLYYLTKPGEAEYLNQVLSAKPGERDSIKEHLKGWLSLSECQSEKNILSSVWGERFEKVFFTVMPGQNFLTYLHGIGLSRETYSYDFGSETFLLIGAKIKGVEYGDLTNRKEVNDREGYPQYYSIQNYPNPFNPATTIVYMLPARSFVEIRIFDIIGREIKLLINRVLDAGKYELKFDGSGLPSGVYFIRMITKEKVLVRKITLAK